MAEGAPKRRLGLVSNQAVKELSPAQRAEVDRKLEAIINSTKPFELTQSDCSKCDGNRGCCGGKNPIGETLQKEIKNEGSVSFDEKQNSLASETKNRRVAEPEHIIKTFRSQDNQVATNQSQVALALVSKLNPHETDQGESRDFQIKERRYKDTEALASRRIGFVVLGKEGVVVQNTSPTEVYEEKGQNRAQRIDENQPAIKTQGTQEAQLKIDFPMPETIQNKTIRFRTKILTVGETQTNQTQDQEKPQEMRIKELTQMEKLIQKIKNIKIPSNDNLDKREQITKLIRVNPIEIINKVEIKENKVRSSQNADEINRVREEPKIIAARAKHKEVALSSPKKKTRIPKIDETNRNDRGKSKEMQKMNKERKEAVIQPIKTTAKEIKPKVERAEKVEKEAKILTNQIVSLMKNQKFIKMNFRETKELEARIKKLLAKKAENRAKKKISIFELLEIFKKIKKKKAKSKLAA